MKGQSLRQIEIKIRDKSKHVCHVIDSDNIPLPFINYISQPILLPLRRFDKFQSVNVEADMAYLRWSSTPLLTYAAIIRGMHEQFLGEVAKLSGALKNPNLEKETPKLNGRVYDVQVTCEDKLVPTAIIPTEARLFQVYFDGDWYLWIR